MAQSLIAFDIKQVKNSNNNYLMSIRVWALIPRRQELAWSQEYLNISILHGNVFIGKISWITCKIITTTLSRHVNALQNMLFFVTENCDRIYIGQNLWPNLWPIFKNCDRILFSQILNFLWPEIVTDIYSVTICNRNCDRILKIVTDNNNK